MVERLNGRISELLQQARFNSRADLETTMLNYLKLYNHHISQRTIAPPHPGAERMAEKVAGPIREARL